MRKILFLLFAVLSVSWGCKKATTQFVLNTRLDPVFVDRILVVTNQKNERLAQFTVPANSTEIINTVEVEDAEDNRLVDIHLIDSTQQFGTPSVTTARAVPNGAEVFMGTLQSKGDQSSAEKVFTIIKIENAPDLDYMGIAGIGWCTPTDNHFLDLDDFDLGTKQIGCYRIQDRDILLRVKATGSATYRSILLPTHGRASNAAPLVVQWSDFQEINPVRIQTPDNAGILVFNLTALTPDAIQTPVTMDIAPDDIPFDTNLSYRDLLLPNNWLADYTYWLNARVNDWTVEKMILPGEAIVLQRPDLQISAIKFDNRTISVTTSGTDVDFLDATIFLNKKNNTSSLRWLLSGNATSMANYELPDFSDLLPPDAYPVEYNKFILVTAHQFGQHDFEDIRAGYPFRTTGANIKYPVAASTHYQVQRIIF